MGTLGSSITTGNLALSQMLKTPPNRLLTAKHSFASLEDLNFRAADLGRWIRRPHMTGSPTQGATGDWVLFLTSSRSKSEITRERKMSQGDC